MENTRLRYSPVSTALADGSARSRADFPSVLRMFGSPPCWSSTVQGKHKQYRNSGRQRLLLGPLALLTGRACLGMARTQTRIARQRAESSSENSPREKTHTAVRREEKAHVIERVRLRACDRNSSVRVEYQGMFSDASPSLPTAPQRETNGEMEKASAGVLLRRAKYSAAPRASGVYQLSPLSLSFFLALQQRSRVHRLTGVPLPLPTLSILLTSSVILTISRSDSTLSAPTPYKSVASMGLRGKYKDCPQKHLFVV